MGVVSILRGDHLGRVVPLLLSVGLACAPMGCATQVNSPSQPILFLSDPPGAEVWVDDRYSVMTPGKVRVSRLSSHHARVEKVGYQPVAVELDRGMSLWTLVDIVCLPLVMKCVYEDIEDGGYYAFDDEVHVTLTRLPEAPPQASSEFRSESSVESSLESSRERTRPEDRPEARPEALSETLPESIADPLAP
jgi:hypothetical protein